MSEITDTFEHERLLLFSDPDTGLRGVVAIHSTALGPAMGGLRLRRYPDIDAAAGDALRLARAMTLKNSAAGLDLGGGKAVLLDDGEWDDRDARLRAFGDVVESLGGAYITAEDIGTTTEDMDLIAERTRWVVGRSRQGGGLDDPSPATARTVFGAIEAGARLTMADADPARAAAVAAAVGAEVVPVEGFIHRDVEVLSPCAVGELIAAADVPSLRCRVIAGAANNPLVGAETALALHRAGILYVPDFIANSGGIVQVSGEYEGLDEEAIAVQQAATIARIGEVLDEAGERGVPPREVAVERALARVSRARAAA
jgi:leucine dehydrogenase